MPEGAPSIPRIGSRPAARRGCHQSAPKGIDALRHGARVRATSILGDHEEIGIGVRTGRCAALAAMVLAVAGAARAAPIVSVDTVRNTPGIQPTRSVAVGTAFEIDVVVAGVAAPDVLTGYELDLVFDTSVLALAAVQDGGFIPYPLFIFDVTPGPTGVHVWAAIRSFGEGAVGDGILLRVVLEALRPGESSLVLEEVALGRPFSAVIGPIPLGGIEHGSVQVVPEPATGLLLGLGCGALAGGRRRATSR
jgi:hypothetical protein